MPAALRPIPFLALSSVGAFDHVTAGEWAQLAHVLDAGIDGLSPKQQALAEERAARRLGVTQLDAQDDQHLRVLWDELRAAVLRVSLDRLVQKRELEVAGVADSGHLVYRCSAAAERS